MSSEEDCQYCERAFRTESKLVAHLSVAHSQEELSRIDQRRVNHHDQDSSSRLQELRSDIHLSRRAALATVGVGIAGGVFGLGGGVSGQSGPDEIADWSDLDDVRNGLGDEYVLVNDIDKTTTGYPGTGDDFTPIRGFTGTFDGNNHTIADLRIDNSNDNVGLFGKIDSSGVVKNTILSQVDVTGGGLNGQHVGGLFGYSNGTVRTSFVTGDVSSPSTSSLARVGGLGGRVGTGGKVTECGADVTVEATNDGGEIGGEIGGLLGQVWQGGVVEDSYATGDVTGDNDVGGVVGIVSPTDQGDKDEVRRSYATGDVTGTGPPPEERNNGEDRRSYGSTDVTGTASETAGGIVGSNSRFGGSGGLVEKSYWDRGTTNQADAIGTDEGDSNTLTGFGSPGDTQPASEMQGSEAETNMTELDFGGTWETVSEDDSDASGDGYPILQAINRRVQLEARGIFTQSAPAIKIEGDNTSISNVTIRGG